MSSSAEHDPVRKAHLTTVENARQCYDDNHFVRSTDKAVTGQKEAVVWGTHLDSDSGAAGTPATKRLRLFHLLGDVLSLPMVPKGVCGKFLGLCVHPFMHRKEFMSVFHRSYRWMRSIPEHKLVPVPADIADEWVTAGNRLLVARSFLRWPISTRVSCTDATPLSGGAVACNVSSELASALWRDTE